MGAGTGGGVGWGSGSGKDLDAKWNACTGSSSAPDLGASVWQWKKTRLKCKLVVVVVEWRGFDVGRWSQLAENHLIKSEARNSMLCTVRNTKATVPEEKRQVHRSPLIVDLKEARTFSIKGNFYYNRDRKIKIKKAKGTKSNSTIGKNPLQTT